MNTSQIKLGGIYALQTPEGVVRFSVFQIHSHTVRAISADTLGSGPVAPALQKGSASDTTNHITGIIAEGDQPSKTKEERTLTVTPDRLLGSFEQIQALRDRADAEDRARKEKRATIESERVALRDLLYEITGLENKGRSRLYSQHFEPIDVDYNGIILKDHATLLALTEALRALKKA